MSEEVSLYISNCTVEEVDQRTENCTEAVVSPVVLPASGTGLEVYT
jgi:hypothetical protein